MLLPSHVAKFHLDAKNLEEREWSLLRWLVYRVLDDVYQGHQVSIISNDEVQGGAIATDKGDTLPVEESTILLYLILFFRLSYDSILHKICHTAFIIQDLEAAPLIVVLNLNLFVLAAPGMHLNYTSVNPLESWSSTSISYADDLGQS